MRHFCVLYRIGLTPTKSGLMIEQCSPSKSCKSNRHCYDGSSLRCCPRTMDFRRHTPVESRPRLLRGSGGVPLLQRMLQYLYLWRTCGSCHAVTRSPLLNVEGTMAAMNDNGRGRRYYCDNEIVDGRDAIPDLTGEQTDGHSLLMRTLGGRSDDEGGIETCYAKGYTSGDGRFGRRTGVSLLRRPSLPHRCAFHRSHHWTLLLCALPSLSLYLYLSSFFRSHSETTCGLTLQDCVPCAAE
ncbi:unnamed protein product [Polarella glacialis]|uniref:Uncharacterized protein n=1 Tax=Polarella glacialis TaxID=89957 RepID=A0A813K4V7_POLGL|nr:unnamed protein product [Polarella glacialis]